MPIEVSAPASPTGPLWHRRLAGDPMRSIYMNLRAIKERDVPAWYWVLAIAVAATWLMPNRVPAADGRLGHWLNELNQQLASPLFWFGIMAQGLFFMRFFWQWLVSERRKRSIVPIGFWYLSLAGGICFFIYGCLRPDLVIMLGQILSCIIYVRNLMLIYQQAECRKRAGLPVDNFNSAVSDQELPD